MALFWCNSISLVSCLSILTLIWTLLFYFYWFLLACHIIAINNLSLLFDFVTILRNQLLIIIVGFTIPISIFLSWLCCRFVSDFWVLKLFSKYISRIHVKQLFFDSVALILGMSTPHIHLVKSLLIWMVNIISTITLWINQNRCRTWYGILILALKILAFTLFKLIENVASNRILRLHLQIMFHIDILYLWIVLIWWWWYKLFNFHLII